MTEAVRAGSGRRTAVLLAASSGLLLALAFPGVDLGPLALVALMPLLWVWHDAGPGRGALTGFVAGTVFFGIHLSWSWYFGAVAIAPLVAAQATYWAGAGALVGVLARRGLRSPFLVAAAWVLAEAFRTRWPLGGLAWGEAGVALHDLDAARALASWGGVPLVTFVVVACNGLLVQLVMGLRAQPRRIRSALTGLGVLVGLAVVGTLLRYEPRATGRLRFALLQGNDKNRYLTQEELDRQYLTRSHLALATRLRGRYDLIVFPESSLESDPEQDPVLRAELGRIAREHGAWILANVIDDVSEPPKSFNANRLYDPEGRLVGTYAKRHLVPFGEYVPWRDSLRFIDELQQIPHDFSPGHRIGIETVSGHRIGSVICFESAFGPIMRANAAAGAEVVVVTTNNRSYRRSANSAQHVALSQMSAAAIGRPVLHASVSGITAVIDADGDIRRTSRLFHNTVIEGSVTPVTGETPYVRYGDWVEWGSGLAVLGALGIAFRPRRKIPHSSGQGSAS